MLLEQSDREINSTYCRIFPEKEPRADIYETSILRE